MPKSRHLLAALLTSTLVVAMAACSSSDTTAEKPLSSTTSTTTTQPKRAEGPAAVVDKELTAGSSFIGSSRSTDLEAEGYEQLEFQVSGSANAYEGTQPEDGQWDLKTTGTEGEFVTRIMVRRPSDTTKANGVVLVEWLNVSGGIDADPDFAFMSKEILRSGTTWVGVSAQHIGVEGGPTAISLSGDNPMLSGIQGKGLKNISPERYGDLSHPGDQYSYDIYTQIARLVRSGDSAVLAEIKPSAVIAVGESQSGFALTTYANGIQPLTQAFDGFFIHSRGGASLPLSVDGPSIDITSAISGDPVRIRTDLDVPVLMFQTESDVVGLLNFLPARQPDTDLIRTWEVAGTAHADKFLLGPVGELAGCEPPVNDGPQRFVVLAALRSLLDWVDSGEAPSSTEPLEVDDAGKYVRDDFGIVKGGIRTPLVDTPVDMLSGEPGGSPSPICFLTGQTVPLTPEQLSELYESEDDYLSQFEAATDAAISSGSVLSDERADLLASAQPERIAS